MYTYTSKTCSHCEFGHIACGQELLRKIVSWLGYPPHKVYCSVADPRFEEGGFQVCG